MVYRSIGILVFLDGKTLSGKIEITLPLHVHPTLVYVRYNFSRAIIGDDDADELWIYVRVDKYFSRAAIIYTFL